MGTDLKPDIAVGDFDSLSKEGEAYMETLTNTEILRLKPEKDDSDTQSAVNYAIEHGAGKIMILGATGNRIDHLMANFGLLMLGCIVSFGLSVIAIKFLMGYIKQHDFKVFGYYRIVLGVLIILWTIVQTVIA